MGDVPVGSEPKLLTFQAGISMIDRTIGSFIDVDPRDPGEESSGVRASTRSARDGKNVVRSSSASPESEEEAGRSIGESGRSIGV
jgi:hypothetical protein